MDITITCFALPYPREFRTSRFTSAPLPNLTFCHPGRSSPLVCAKRNADGHGNGASTTDVYQLWSPPGKALRDYDENCFVITLTKKEEKVTEEVIRSVPSLIPFRITYVYKEWGKATSL